MAPAVERGSERVAVIGAGIAGLASAFLLSEDGKHVTLFESEKECGGHALTVDSPVGPVDLGFQVCNLTTYPHLMGFLRTLGVDTEPSDMSFALSTPSVEWGSRGLEGMFAQPGCWKSPQFLRMFAEIIRFSKNAEEVLDPHNAHEWGGSTLGDYLRKRGYSSFFAKHYVVPMCAAIWSCSDDDALAWPVISLVTFWKNHHLLSLFERPVWRVLKGRSKTYVDAVVARLDDVRTGTSVTSVKRLPSGGVEVSVAGQPAETFDHVVFATHSDVTLRLLGSSASVEERAALEKIRYQPNEVYLHTDESLMPRQKAAWASWNCMQLPGAGKAESVCVSYWVNLLQNLPEGAPQTFVTLNPPTPPDAAKTHHKVTLSHPLLNLEALSAQKQLSTGKLQGVDGVWYAGAWCGYGFHEDGIRSAVEVVTRLSGKGSKAVPWEAVSCDPHLTLIQKGFLRLFTSYGQAMLHPSAAIRMVLPDGSESTVGDANAKPNDKATVYVRNGSLFSRVVMRSDIGLGEAYMDGDFVADDLYHFIEVISRISCEPAAKEATYSSLGLLGGALYNISERLEMAAHRANSNTEAGSARNISYHYDAGNDFYKLFLDKTMMYSSGVHKGGLAALEGLSFEQKERALEDAQYAKLDAMIEQAQLKPGEHVLEIGCGWGAMAIRMAQKAGVRVTGITVSREQLVEARARVAAAGLSERVELIFCDYRKVEGTFDKIVSIEMLEAVGHEHLHTYFEAISRYLKPGGIAAVQVITLPNHRYKLYCDSHSDFIRTYIFPGGHLPSLGAMVSVSSQLGLELTGLVDVGPDYAISLRLWRERMLHRIDQVLALGYPRRFVRMYEFYFAYCEAGFANGLIHDYQITWVKSPLSTPKHLTAPAAAPSAEAPLDVVTASLLALWAGLFAALVYYKHQVAIVAAAFSGFLALRTLLSRLGGLPQPKASSYTAIVAAITLASTSSTLLATALRGLASTAAPPAAASGLNWPFGKPPTAAPSPASATSVLSALTELLLSPTTPPELLEGARLVVGLAAGYAALRTWECVREPRQRTRSMWEIAMYTASLACAALALSSQQHLVGLAATQICEAHSVFLRIRALRLQAGHGSSPATWAASWLSFAALRAAPHLLLLAIFGRALATAPYDGTYTLWIAMSGLVLVNVNNCCTAWGLLRAHLADQRTTALANTQHRSTDADASDAPPAPPPATSPPASAPCVLAALGAAAGLAYVTAQQEPDCARLITLTWAAYLGAYMLMRATGVLQPAAGTLAPAIHAEWRSRVLSVVNAVVLIYGSLQCFREWPYTPAVEGWISQHLWSAPVTFAALFVAHLQNDLCWCLWHFHSNPDVPTIIHHTLFIAITHYVLWGWYFKVPFAWLSLTELSTPFLNLRWFLAVLERKSTSLYFLISLAFALTFLATRTVGYSMGMLHLWANRDLWLPAETGLYVTIAGCHAGWALNLYWTGNVVGALRRAATRAKTD